MNFTRSVLRCIGFVASYQAAVVKGVSAALHNIARQGLYGSSMSCLYAQIQLFSSQSLVEFSETDNVSTERVLVLDFYQFWA